LNEPPVFLETLPPKIKVKCGDRGFKLPPVFDREESEVQTILASDNFYVEDGRLWVY
jgi:hypothetical protein